MIELYDTLGIENPDVKQVKHKLELLLGIIFKEHESSYLGVYYLANLSNGSELQLMQNFADGEWQLEEYKDYPLIVKVNYSNSKLLRILNKSDQIYHLCRTELEPKKYAKKYKVDNGALIFISEQKINNPFNRN